METEGNPILCFQHCDESQNVLCLKMPATCPLCDGNLFTTPLLIPPFRMPSPLIHSTERPYSIVIRPTIGTFLSNYSNSDDLHVGITDSRGAVYDFNKHGVNRSLDGWSQCIAIPILEKGDIKEKTMWDIRLSEFTTFNDWIASKYSADEQNCYEFAMSFLNLMELNDKHPSISSRSDFCKEMIIPQTSQAAKYISMYRQLIKGDLIVCSMQSASDNASTTQL